MEGLHQKKDEEQDMNYMDFEPHLIRERNEQLQREVDSLRLEERLREDRGSSGPSERKVRKMMIKNLNHLRVVLAAAAAGVLAALAMLVVAAVSPAEASFPGQNGKIAFQSNRDAGPMRPGISAQVQLSGKVDTSFAVDAYDIDGFDNGTAVVDRVHARGAKAICYISAGSWEDWRPDASDFPDSVKGKKLADWPGEKWLDIRRLEVLRPIMAKRMDMCAAKGFDAVDPDNVDGYTQETGFKITAADQLDYNRMLARMAHGRGLLVGLKNDTDQVRALVSNFDFSVVESCFRYTECGRYSPFVEAGKAVIAIEYSTKNMKTKCTRARELRFSLIFKKDLSAPRRAC